VDPGKWEPVTASLSYRLGEISLWDKRFSGFANREHFTSVETYPRYPDPSFEFEPQPDFVLYPTYPVASAPEVLASSGSWIIYTPYTFRNHYIDLKRIGGFDAYLAGFSSKSRWTLHKKIKRFAEASGGQISWREFTRPGEMAEFCLLAREVSRKTYQERLLSTGLPSSADFVARATALAGFKGVLGFILLLDSRPVAYMCCFCVDGIVTYDYLGYDPAFQPLSPGSVLQYLTLQSLFDCHKDVRIFDFTGGEAPQKSFFGRENRLCARSYFFRRTLINIALVGLHYRLDRFVESAGYLFDRCGIKQPLKKLIRAVA
jgi:hypothetical protein